MSKSGNIRMKLLSTAVVLAIAPFAMAQDAAAAIARFEELGIAHNNNPIDEENLGNIQSLRIDRESGNQLTDDDLLHLSALPRLGHLTISSAPEITPAGMAHLAQIENLW